jgi:hypothetical protein
MTMRGGTVGWVSGIQPRVSGIHTSGIHQEHGFDRKALCV